jgi:hypothetical protein
MLVSVLCAAPGTAIDEVRATTPHNRPCRRTSRCEVGKLELNSESGTLLRPIDEVIGTMDSRREKKTTRLEAGQRRQPQFLMPVP